MDKIPVGATIARAYGFVFGQFFTLLGIVWLSWAVIAGGAILLMRQATTFSTAITTQNFSAIGPLLLVLLPFYLVTLILILMQYVGFTEQALGLRKGSPYFYFKLGQPLWRLVLSFLLTFVIVLATMLAMALIIGALGGIVAATGAGVAGGLVVALITLILYCGFIYLVVRLTFLMTPVVVAENQIGLRRAWALGKGNFWRMFVIILAVTLPIFTVSVILMMTFLFRGMPLPPPGADPAQLAQYRAAAAAWQAGVTARMIGSWYITYPVYIVFTVLFYGLSASAQAFAYRAISPDDPAAEFS